MQAACKCALAISAVKKLALLEQARTCMDSDGEEAARGAVLHSCASHAGRKIEAGVTRVGPKDRNACELGSAIAHSSINLDACISFDSSDVAPLYVVLQKFFFFSLWNL
jgi:hypothetical protein